MHQPVFCLIGVTCSFSFQILLKIFSQVQSELFENSRKPKRYETVPGKSYKAQH